MVVFVLAVDVWIYADARRFADRGTPVVFRSALLTLETPLAWFLGCLVLAIFFIPLYLVARRD